ncbi:MAG: MAPEG family protein [Pseudomonadota bacterium]
MTSELTFLALSAVLAASLWVPFIVGVNTEAKTYTDFTRPPDLRGMRPWVHRAYRAHQNMLETLMPFAVLVLIAHSVGVSTTVTVWASAAFFALRVAHAVGMISGLARFPIRPVIFTASWLCTLAIAVSLLLA